jgi:hypothetical protein
LLVDADPRPSHIDLNSTREPIDTEVQPGEHVVLVVYLVDLHNGIVCVRLCETGFELEVLPLE